MLVVFDELFLPKGVITSGLNIATNNSNIFISTTFNTTVLNSVGSVTLVMNAFGPNLGIKDLVGGTNITLISSNSTIFVNSPSISLTSLGGITLVGASVGPVLSIRGIADGSSVTIVSSATTLMVNSSTINNALSCGKFVVTDVGLNFVLTTVFFEFTTPFKKLTSDSTADIINTPQNYRFYNNTGASRLFRVDADLSLTTVTGTIQAGLYLTSESSASLNTDYQYAAVLNAATVTRSMHMSRNITIPNGQYVSLWMRTTASSINIQTLAGTSVTLNTID